MHSGVGWAVHASGCSQRPPPPLVKEGSIDVMSLVRLQQLAHNLDEHLSSMEQRAKRLSDQSPLAACVSELCFVDATLNEKG